jgi:hypothetical protein
VLVVTLCSLVLFHRGCTLPGQVIAPEAFAVARDSNLWHIWQTLPASEILFDIWSNWANHGAPSGVRFSSPPAVVRNNTGRLELFIIGSNNQVSHIWQPTPNGAWSDWWVHNGPPNGAQGAPAVGINQDGRLEVFVVDRRDHWLYSQPQTAPSNGWSPDWFPFGAPAGVRLASSPGVGSNADGRLEVFVVGSDGFLWKKDQTAPNNGWSDWLTHGAPDGSVRWVSSPVVVPNQDGRMELFMVGTDGQLWHEWQTAPNNGWSGWASLGSPPGRRLVGTPAVGMNAAVPPAGRLEVFAVTDDGRWWHLWQVTPNSGWSDWDASWRIRPGTGHGNLAVGSNADGRLEVFGSDGELVHEWQDLGSDTLWWKGNVSPGPGPPLPTSNPPDSLGSPPGAFPSLIPWGWPLLSG